MNYKLALAGLALSVSSIANAALIGLSSADVDTGKVYSIDPITGQATELASLGLTSLVGATFLDGKFYGTDVCSNPCFSMGEIDINNGDYTALNNQDGSANWHGLASNESLGLMYAIDLNDNNILKSINAAGDVTSIGTGTGISASGMAFDDLNDILYSTDFSGNLYSVDIITGTSSLIGNMGISSSLLGLAFDEVNQTLFANNSSSLYSIDTTSGTASLIGSNGVFGIDGLAWIDTTTKVPEPTTLVMLSLGLFGLASRKSKK